MPKTHPVDGWAEVDFNAEPFLTDFKSVYQSMHANGCPYAHSTTGDHYAVASHKEIMDILKQYDVWKSKVRSGARVSRVAGRTCQRRPAGAHLRGAHRRRLLLQRDLRGARAGHGGVCRVARGCGVCTDGEMDLHEWISIPFPLFVIHKLLGIPMEDPDGTSRLGLHSRWHRHRGGYDASVGR